MDTKTEEKIYECLEAANQKIDPEITKIEQQLGNLSDEIELLIPPDQYKTYMEVIAKQEKLKWKRDFLNFSKVYKGALKEGLLMGIELEI